MKVIKTEIMVDATIDQVWPVLTNFPAYSQWNPFIRGIEGRLAIGERLKVTIQPPQQKAMMFRPKIIALSPYEELAWKGSLFVPGIFDGVHRFILKKTADNKTLFTHTECFSGLLQIPLFCLIGKSTEQGFQLMNQLLKDRCELQGK